MRIEKSCKLVVPMGCLKLEHSAYLPVLKVAKGFFLSEEKTDASPYRYGFNGMEKDNEMYASSGNSYTTEFRQYSPRLGRWLSLDPLMAKYPSQSGYASFNNNPIYFSDPTGLEGKPSNGGGKGRKLNKDINGGRGNEVKAGTTERFASGTVVYADVTINEAGEKNTKSHSNAYQIAKSNGITLDELYSMNPGLEANNRKIGQGQMIFVRKDQYGVSGDSRKSIDDAPKKSGSSSGVENREREERYNGPKQDADGNPHRSTPVDEPPDEYKKTEENQEWVKSFGDGEYSEHSKWQKPYPIGFATFEMINIEDSFVTPGKFRDVYFKLSDTSFRRFGLVGDYQKKYGKYPLHLPLINKNATELQKQGYIWDY